MPRLQALAGEYERPENPQPVAGVTQPYFTKVTSNGPSTVMKKVAPSSFVRKRCSATLGAFGVSGWLVGLPIPGHQFVDAFLRPAVDEACQ
jgi:hypothetical protein